MVLGTPRIRKLPARVRYSVNCRVGKISAAGIYIYIYIHIVEEDFIDFSIIDEFDPIPERARVYTYTK